MILGELWRRLRSHMPEESPIDLDTHTDRIADEVERVRENEQARDPGKTSREILGKSGED